MDTAVHTHLSIASHPEVEAFKQHFVRQRKHPCLTVKTVLNTNPGHFRIYTHLGSFSTARKMFRDITLFLAATGMDRESQQSFVAVFTGEKDYSEIAFELLMWQQLQALQECDSNTGWNDHDTDRHEGTSFSFNVAGRAFRVAGMHPQSSCMVRRSPFPALVFNLHKGRGKKAIEEMATR